MRYMNMLRPMVAITLLSILLFGACSPQKDNELTSLCGFDFSKMDWKTFNEDVIIKLYGIGCGYEAGTPARKHVFYDATSGLWIQFNIIKNDKWLGGIEISKNPLCTQKVQPLNDIASCKLLNDYGVGNNIEGVKRLYGEGKIASDKIQYMYRDIDVGANVYFGKNNIVTGYKVFSLVP